MRTRLGVTASQWEHAVTVTSRRLARELDVMAMIGLERPFFSLVRSEWR